MKFSLILSAFFSFFLLQAANAQNSYYPLEKGKAWFYSYEDTYAQTPNQKSKVEVLDDTKIINGKEYFAVQTSLSTEGNYRVLQTIYLRNGSNGTILGVVKESDKQESVFLPAKPWNKGKEWSTNAMGIKSTSKIKETSTSIETPGKTFANCLLIEVDMGETIVRNYFKEDVGLVAVAMVTGGQEMLLQYLEK